MKIKVPREIEIGALRAKVSFKEYMKVDENWRGSYNQRTGELHIEPTCGKVMDNTFIHEVVHIVDLNYEVGLSEENITRLAHGLTEFLYRNLGIEFDWSDVREE